LENNCNAPRTRLAFGQKLADIIAKWGGSWSFLIFLSLFLAIWMGINVAGFVMHWDPYPFILLNLFLSCLATYQAPIILMAQNRAAERDRVKAERDYAINRKAEREIEDIQKDLEEIKDAILAHHTSIKKSNQTLHETITKKK